MSTEFGIKVRDAKNTAAKAYTLFWLSTTPARQIYSEVSLDDSGEDVPLTEKKLEEIIGYYKNEIVTDKATIEVYKHKIAFETDILKNAVNAEIQQTSRDNINYYTEDIANAQDDIETMKYYLNILENIQDSMDIDFEQEWAFFYYIG